ncbi:MAG: hypothetical protein HRT61_23690 [Ekhidna sp.]|nr:hypothetical protein [Ekhidna sp.]
MSKNEIEIKPGIGLGKIKFGMSREEVESILGPASHKEFTYFDEDEQDKSDAWEYHPLRLDLSFEEAEGYRLMIIGVSSEDYLLQGSSLIGLSTEELMEELELLGFTDLEIEDLSTEDEPDQKLLSSESNAVNFWLQSDILEEIQWGTQFSDDETIRWPE